MIYPRNASYHKLNEHIFFSIEKIPTQIIASPAYTVYNGDKYLIITLKDNKGHIITEGGFYVTLKETWVIGLNSNGKAKLSTNGLAPKTYIAKIIFYGDNYYKSSSITVKVIVKKANPKITAKPKTFKKKIKTKKYTIILKTNKNKVMKNTKLTIKINKKSYNAKTNSKGKVTFKITKLTKKGKYTATITFKGNAYYNKLTKKVKIKVKYSSLP